MRRKTGAQIGVHHAVDGEVNAGVQVSQHRRVEVHGQRKSVGRVVQNDDEVRRPAADERHEDDKHRLHPANGLHRRHEHGFSSRLHM